MIHISSSQGTSFVLLGDHLEAEKTNSTTVIVVDFQNLTLLTAYGFVCNDCFAVEPHQFHVVFAYVIQM